MQLGEEGGPWSQPWVGVQGRVLRRSLTSEWKGGWELTGLRRRGRGSSPGGPGWHGDGLEKGRTAGCPPGQGLCLPPLLVLGSLGHSPGPRWPWGCSACPEWSRQVEAAGPRPLHQALPSGQGPVVAFAGMCFSKMRPTNVRCIQSGRQLPQGGQCGEGPQHPRSHPSSSPALSSALRASLPFPHCEPGAPAVM